MSLLDEIKRRKVFRLAIAYLVVAWVIVQVVDVIKEPLSLPAWFDTVTIVLLAIMFPIALMLSWAYDVTPAGVVRDGESVPAASIDYGKIALVAVLILGAFLAGNVLTGSSERRTAQMELSADYPVERFQIRITAPFEIQGLPWRTFWISPDGQTIVVLARIEDQPQLLSRSLDQLSFSAIDGTENVGIVFTGSPDGRWLTFQDSVDGQLKKTPIDGGPAITLGDPGGIVQDITWNEFGSIVFATSAHNGIQKMDEGGGIPESLVVIDSGGSPRHVTHVPGSDTLMISIGERGRSANSDDRLAFVSSDGNIMMTDVFGASPRIVSDKYVIYFHRNALWAASLDVEELAIGRDPVAIADNVDYAQGALFAVSQQGSLLYQSNHLEVDKQLVLVDRQGNEEVLPFEPRNYIDPSVSPDGTRIAVTTSSPYGPDVWMHSLDGRDSFQITSEESLERVPTWHPDGRVFYFSAERLDNIYRFNLDTMERAEQITKTQTMQFPQSITPDGEWLLFEEGRRGDPSVAIAVMNLHGEPDTRYLVANNAMNRFPVISPDGRWFAYQSNISGNAEIYVRPFPNADDGVWQVSRGGGTRPDWNLDGSEIFYFSGSEMVVVAVNSNPGFSTADPVALFDTSRYNRRGLLIRSRPYTALDKFIFTRAMHMGDEVVDEIVFVRNWPSLLPDAE